MNVYEKIKSLSLEDLTGLIRNIDVRCQRCVYNGNNCNDRKEDDCFIGRKKWMEKEVEIGGKL